MVASPKRRVPHNPKKETSEFRPEEISSTTQRRLYDSVREALGDRIDREEIDAHFQYMPARYWERVSHAEVVWHLETVHQFFQCLLENDGEDIVQVTPIVSWRHLPLHGCSQVLICNWDRHGIFAKIAGAFATNGINVLSADVYTRRDNLILDIFHVSDSKYRHIQQESSLREMRRTLIEALNRNSDLPFEEIPSAAQRSKSRSSKKKSPAPEIVFNNQESEEYTILSIQAQDYLGLLHDVLQVLALAELSVAQAKVHTQNGLARDFFYLTDLHGKKVTEPLRLNLLQEQLREMIEAH
jgi:[protein-PII] uridylyltransferase